ncbi:hypothetical protein BC332_34802 [Capsicum chinense]|nr:hypothetical protein BC332_34802 [Capsicum chinense]
MREYESLGHMELANDANPGAYYIPHHCVHSAGKFRVVFDASMKTSNGLSLNSVLYTGPKLQANIVDILIRMRTYKIVLVADITKMFRQILIRPEDRKFQHILWRENDNEPIKDYVLNTVTYGTGSSPFLANRTIKQLGTDERENYPDACESIEDNIYVDDWIFGDESLSKLLPQRDQAIKLARSGGFELKKWSSNDPAALEGIDCADLAIPLDFGQEPGDSHGVLGARWTPKGDVYSYKPLEFSTTLTKRAIVSNMSRIFDPLGWIAPCILAIRIIVQKLWIAGVDWDEKIPTGIADYWLNLLSELPLLTSLKIPRLIINTETKVITLIGFSDGSQSGYGASIYVVTNFEGHFDSNLLMAKSKSFGKNEISN